ncbi:hypothetical protein CMV_009144 [Castanea mollissima]|uniref:Uncharacterized protein n=1 Tax=Castanea mollissima TaxID=60419 RepID=A0A8J4RLI2_9ROSI|nr:hypothetical protein CMV_009144 [Castanea mollissima]
MKWNLAVLASTKPPFVPPNNYHRFSSVVADREAEALLSSHLISISFSLSTKPNHFYWVLCPSLDDYHRFSSIVTDREGEALVVRSPELII